MGVDERTGLLVSLEALEVLLLGGVLLVVLHDELAELNLQAAEGLGGEELGSDQSREELANISHVLGCKRM